jgi:hypothetical protein
MKKLKDIKYEILNDILIVVFILSQVIPIVWMGVYLYKNSDRVEEYYTVTVSNIDADHVIMNKRLDGYELIGRDYCQNGEPNELYSGDNMVTISMIKLKNP